MKRVLAYTITGFTLVAFGFAFLAFTNSSLTAYMVTTPAPVIPSASVVAGVVSLLVGAYRLNNLESKGTDQFLSEVDDFKKAHEKIGGMRVDKAFNLVMKLLVNGALTKDYKKIGVYHEFEDQLMRKVKEADNPVYLQRAIITIGNAISVMQSMENFDKKHLKNLRILHGTAKTYLLKLYNQQETF